MLKRPTKTRRRRVDKREASTDPEGAAQRGRRAHKARRAIGCSNENEGNDIDPYWKAKLSDSTSTAPSKHAPFKGNGNGQATSQLGYGELPVSGKASSKGNVDGPPTMGGKADGARTKTGAMKRHTHEPLSSFSMPPSKRQGTSKVNAWSSADSKRSSTSSSQSGSSGGSQ